jgi:hypothetical protein
MYTVAANNQNQSGTSYSLRHYDKLCILILLIANLVIETFHVLEIELHHSEERRGVEDLNYLHLCYAS